MPVSRNFTETKEVPNLAQWEYAQIWKSEEVDFKLEVSQSFRICLDKKKRNGIGKWDKKSNNLIWEFDFVLPLTWLVGL